MLASYCFQKYSGRFWKSLLEDALVSLEEEDDAWVVVFFVFGCSCWVVVLGVFVISLFVNSIEEVELSEEGEKVEDEDEEEVDEEVEFLGEEPKVVIPIRSQNSVGCVAMKFENLTDRTNLGNTSCFNSVMITILASSKISQTLFGVVPFVVLLVAKSF